MTVSRIMGLETEYGVLRSGDVKTTPMALSGEVVMAYAEHLGLTAAQSQWDYLDESPLHDARGYDVARESAHPSQLTDALDPSFANVVLPNGARWYVDHAHPEYSGPECLTPQQAVRYDRAGDVIAQQAASLLSDDPRGVTTLYKNNTDGRGASYGTHENYLVRRDVPFHQFVSGLTPFFVARNVIIGSGRVGIGPESERSGYQITQRADFFEAEVGLETTFRRPIINTRDEPHADSEKYRRLHVIVGDANLSDIANLMKLGMTSLVLGAIEAQAAPHLTLRHPVAALKTVSHDLTLTAPLELTDGRHVTALDMLEMYRDAVARWLESTADDPTPAATQDVMQRWTRLLEGLRTNPANVAADIEWLAKKNLLDGYRTRHGLDWDDPRLRALDIQWSLLDSQKGVARALERRGNLTRLTQDDDVTQAVSVPPAETRAWTRGQAVHHFADDLAQASWDSLVVRTHQPHAYVRVRMLEPLAGNAAETSGWFEHGTDHFVAKVGPTHTLSGTLSRRLTDSRSDTLTQPASAAPEPSAHPASSQEDNS